MKNNLLLLTFVCCLSFGIMAQTTSIPDSNFEQALIDLSIDTNGLNGNILNSDALAQTTLAVNDKAITDLTGIEAFVNLTELFAMDNQLTSIDLSANTNLERVGLSRNSTFTNLDVSMLTNLQDLFIDALSLTTIDVSQNANLNWFYARQNQLTNLNVTQNTALVRLYIGENDIATIDLTNNLLLERFSAYNNHITGFDATANINLQTLDLQAMDAGFGLTSVNVTGLTNLAFLYLGENPITTVNISTNSSLLRLGINQTQINTIDTTNNPLLEYFYGGIAQLTNVDLSSNGNLIFVDVYQNSLTTFNIANGNNAAITTLYANENPNLSCIEVDDISIAYSKQANYEWFKDQVTSYETDCNNPSTNTVYVPDNNLEQALIDFGIDQSGVLDDYILLSEALNTTFLDVNSRNISDPTGIESFIYLTGLNISSNNLTTINISALTYLEYLDVYNNNLNTLNLNNNLSMKNLFCAENNLTGINTSALNLEQLGCNGNNIVSLNLTNSTDLINLWASDNQLNGVDLSTNTLLERIEIANNPNINTIDLSSQMQLTELVVGNTGISTIDIAANPALEILSAYNNNLTSINVANNLNLTVLDLNGNSITGAIDISSHSNLIRFMIGDNNIDELNMQNGNNTAFIEVNISNNQNLTCAQVDDITFANNQVDNNIWQKSSGTLFSTDCSNQPTVYVPDDNLEQELINLGIDTDGVMDDTILLANALSIYHLDLVEKNISDPTGLEAFTNLEGLNISGNNLSVINLSTMSNLNYLDVYNNNLNSLDVSNNTNLKMLYCAENNLTGLNIGALNLRELGCDNNNIVSLNLSNSVDLERIYATNNALNSLDFTNNVNLEYCWISENNNIGNLDLSSQTKLIELGAGNTGMTNVPTNLYNNTNLEILSLYGNNLSSIDINGVDASNNITNTLTDLNLDGCGLSGVIDLSNFSALAKILVSGNQFEGLNIQNGNNANIIDHNFFNNPNLECIQVDNVANANNNLTNKDTEAMYNLDCEYTLSIDTFTNTKISVHPNPTSDIIYINGIQTLNKLELFDATGKQLLDKVNSQSISLNNLPSGIYFLKISDANGVSTKKILKK